MQREQDPGSWLHLLHRHQQPFLGFSVCKHHGWDLQQLCSCLGCGDLSPGFTDKQLFQVSCGFRCSNNGYRCCCSSYNPV
uniref:Uncharacterized protein n=1 Tax=Ficedula albicollis TaxID=59894 RepID=A0A803VUI6_FICAL